MAAREGLLAGPTPCRTVAKILADVDDMITTALSETAVLASIRRDMCEATPNRVPYRFAEQVMLDRSVVGSCSRQIDGVAHEVAPDGSLPYGGDIWAFEIKRSRSDWLRELRNPLKAKPFLARSARFFVVEASAGLIDVAEVPVEMGLLRYSHGRLTVVRDAPSLAPTEDPSVLTVAVAARLGVPVSGCGGWTSAHAA